MRKFNLVIKNCGRTGDAFVYGQMFPLTFLPIDSITTIKCVQKQPFFAHIFHSNVHVFSTTLSNLFIEAAAYFSTSSTPTINISICSKETNFKYRSCV